MDLLNTPEVAKELVDALAGVGLWPVAEEVTRWLERRNAQGR